MDLAPQANSFGLIAGFPEARPEAEGSLCNRDVRSWSAKALLRAALRPDHYRDWLATRK